LETIGGVMKKLIPRNTTIPVRRSDVFSTSENNQTVVEINILQGERQMATDNKSLGKFKLTGIPPAPRGVPQVLVSLDIDANGILQVSALDKTTGREQSVVIQGASILSEVEIDRMLQDAEEYADVDRERRERVTKRTNAEALTFKAERELRDVALDYGMYFAREERRRIEALVKELRQCLEKNDDRGIDSTQADLQDALLELSRISNQRQKEEEEEDNLFNTIKRTFMGGDDDEEEVDYYSPPPRRSPYDSYDRFDQTNRYPRPEQRDQGEWTDSRDRTDRNDRGSQVNRYDSRDRYDRPPQPDIRDTRDTRDKRDRRDRAERTDQVDYPNQDDRGATRKRSKFQSDNWDDDDEWL
jgi:molecular chaperone DnaK